MTPMLPSSMECGVGDNLFLSEEQSDLAIVTGSMNPCCRFPVHQLVLCAQSPVFRRMLESDFAEKASGTITIGDIKPPIIGLMLKYIYSGHVEIEGWESALELLCAAHKYQMDPLVQYCAKRLDTLVTLHNVCSIYNKACVYNILPLKEKCHKLVLDAGFIVLRSNAFQSLSKDVVMDIIKKSDLNIDTEIVAFEALFRWAPLQCCRMGLQVTQENILQVLMPFLKYVCYDDMSDAEKGALPACVTACMGPNNRNRITNYVPEYLLKYSHSFHFHSELERIECIDDSMNCVCFSLNHPQWLVKVKLLFVLAPSEQHRFVTIKMLKESNGAVTNLFSMNRSPSSYRCGLQLQDRQCYVADVILSEPCRLEPKTVYKLRLIEYGQFVYCPKVRCLNNYVLSDVGKVTLSLHCDEIWGILDLTFL